MVRHKKNQATFSRLVVLPARLPAGRKHAGYSVDRCARLSKDDSPRGLKWPGIYEYLVRKGVPFGIDMQGVR